MAFITKTDLGQDIYPEILSGVTRANDSKIAVACAESIDEVNGYVCARYDSADLFSKEGDQRNRTILAVTRTIAIYKLLKVCGKMNELARVEYEDAISLLGKIQSGRFLLEGAKLVGQTDTEIPKTQILRSGITKRDNYI